MLIFAVALAPKMSLQFPRSNLTLSFSDSVVFLTFLIYGGEMAVLIAFVETFATCVYLKRRGILASHWIILFNSSLASLLTTITYVVLLLCFSSISTNFDIYSTRGLIIVLGTLALSQFFVSSIFAAFYQKIKDQDKFFETWKRQCLSASLTQFTGAGLAGVIFKLINYADIVLVTIAFLILSIAYFNYRKMIGEINSAFSQAERAEQEKAEAEREKRIEVEKYAAKLSDSLKKEETANEALRKSQKAFKHAALHDSLTNLANRQQFSELLFNLINGYKNNPDICFHVLFLDIRRFKNINDSLGHTIGDKILTIVAKRFLRMVQKTDTVARLGGDEFAIILRDISTVGKALKVARRIHQSIAQPFSLSGNRIFISVNIGVAPCDLEYNTPEDILRDADIAMHYAKEKGIGVAVFTKELRVRFLERVRLESDLRHALERSQLSMHYQPLISLNEGKIIGFEALLRWHHPELGMISPAKFIPIAEDSGLIVPITIWILQETCEQLAKWRKIAPEFQNLIVSVNISGKHLSNDELVDDVEQALEHSGLPPEALKLEITESVAMENAEHTIDILTRLKQTGVQLSIDDFGTGYSSLNYLHRLPFDTLKIDRSFVYSVGENGENSEILQTIVSLAKNLKMKIIAEGIETEGQLSLLQYLGCDYGQGYLLAKPQPKEEAEQMLFQKSHWLPHYEPEDFDSRNKGLAENNLPVF